MNDEIRRPKAEGSRHTPEPWIADFNCTSVITSSDGFEEVAVVDDSDNAARIVQCVNGCKGIESPEVAVPGLVLALKRARVQIEEMAHRGTEAILDLGRECDPWEKTAAVAINAAGIDEALARAEGRAV